MTSFQGMVIKGHDKGAPNVNCQRKVGHNRICAHYFAENHVYDARVFRKSFKMTRDLSFRIMHVVVQYDDYFAQRIDTCAVLGLSSIQKCVIALGMPAYGISTDATS